MPRKKTVRDASRLSGRPLSETLEASTLDVTAVSNGSREKWVTSRDLYEWNLPFSLDIVYSMMLFVLANPNMNSSHLYRADILHDSLGELETPWEKEAKYESATRDTTVRSTAAAAAAAEPIPAKEVTGFLLSRTLVRKLIPRNPNLDRPMDQTVHFYKDDSPTPHDRRRLLVVYTPHVQSEKDMPWYHPLVRGLAFLYDFNGSPPEAGTGTLSAHFLPYDSEEPLPTLRLERTLFALLDSQIRLSRITHCPNGRTSGGANYKPSKDNIIPQHLVQNTYSRLKLTYAHDLCQRWVEDTMPSKHVFEDLAIAAFLIELWRSMYGACPTVEKQKNGRDSGGNFFPGFVDVACGNGVLVYLLRMEGYSGWGFDARRRKTWGIFPNHVQACLVESIYIPRPFAADDGSRRAVHVHTGAFPRDTFIVSNHADELTLWTPLMATLACPESPLPFLAIPCCSHALSGLRFRYPPPHKQGEDGRGGSDDYHHGMSPAGDLKKLRAEKLASQTTRMEDGNSSMYASLTAKTMNIGREVGFDVEKTLLRIPSTRNMGVVGGRKRVMDEWRIRRAQTGGGDGDNRGEKSEPRPALLPSNSPDGESHVEKVLDVVSRECQRDGGIQQAASIWIDRAIGIHQQGASRRTPSSEQDH